MPHNSIEPPAWRDAIFSPRRARLSRLLFCLQSGIALSVAVSASPAVAQDPLPVTEVAPGIYLAAGAHEEASAANLGAIGNIGFIVGGEAVAVIDTGGSARAGQRLRNAIGVVTDLPVRFVINTHVHPDHIMGNAAYLPDDPVFIGHRNLPRAMAQRGDHYLRRLRENLGPATDGTRLVGPTRTVDDVRDIDLGGRVLRLTAFPAAHTDTDVTVLDIRTAVLWTGDLLFIERVPVIDGSLKGWLAAGADLRRNDTTLVIPGHGPPTPDADAAFEAQERYLRTIQTEIRALISQGGSMEQAVNSVALAERDRWLLFDTYHPRNVVTAYAEIEWE